MADVGGTIIIGKLDDSALKKSIEDLVKSIKDKTNEMATSFDSAINKMNESLGKLAKNSQQASNQRQQAIKEETTTYDQMSKAIDKVSQKYQDNALKTEFFRTMRMPTENVEQMQHKLERLKVLIVSLQDIGLLSPTQIVAAEKAIQLLNGELSKTTSITQQNVQAEVQYTEEIKKQAQAIRESAEMKSTGQATLTGASGYKYVISADSDRLSIEQQLVEMKKYENELAKEYGVVTKQNTQSTNAQATVDERRTKVINEGLKAARKMQEQLSDTNKSQVSINALRHAIYHMHNAYAAMSDDVKNSEIGIFIKKQLDAANNSLEQLEQKTKSTNNTLNTQAQVSEKVKQANLEIEQSNVKLINSNDRLARTFDYIQRRVMFLISTYGSMRLVNQIVSVRSEFETMERSLGVLLDSAQRGSQIFNELNQMALNSPFTTLDLTGAARQLLAYGVAEEELVDTTRRLGDISAAVGTPIDRIAYALGQVQTYGYLTSLQARTFMRGGIPLVKELAEMYTQLEGKIVSTGDVYDRMKHKLVSYDDVLKVIKRDTDEGGRFFDYQAKMADTLKVQIANLNLAYQNMLNDIGRDSQGIFNFFISSLRTTMTHWRDISKLITAAAIAYGVYKTAMMVAMTVQRSKMVLDTRELLNSKTATYQTNERRLALGKLTVAEKEQVLSQRANLISIYKTQIANNELTASEVRKRLQIDRSNIALATAAFDAGLLTKAEYKLIVSTNATAGAFARMGNFLKSNWIFILLTAITELVLDISNMGEVAKNVTNSIIDNTKESAKSLSEFLKQNRDTINSLYTTENGQKTPQNISNEEASKAWDVIRDEIQKSSAASDIFITKLLQIEDVNERVRAGFEYVDKLRSLHETLQLINKDNIEINEDWSKAYTLWLGSDGLKENLEEYVDDLDIAFKTNQRLAEQGKYVGDQMEALAIANERAIDSFSLNLKDDLKDTMDSLRSENIRLDIIDPEAQRESLEQFLANYIQQEGIAAEEASVLRMTAEKEYASMSIAEYDKRLAYAKKINDLEAVNRITVEKNAWLESFGYGRASMQVFFSELKRRHSDLFDGMTREEMAALDENSAQYKAMISFLENEFKNSQISAHKIAYNDLKDRVDDIKTWLIHIPIFFDIIGGEEESVYERLKKADTAADTAYQKMQRLRKEMSRVEKESGKTSDAYKKAADEYSDAVKEYEKAIKEGGESKKENTDQQRAERERLKAANKAERDRKKAERERQKAENKARRDADKAERERQKKQREEEQELATALKDEISLVDKLRSSYDKMRKVGVSQDRIAQDIYNNYTETFKDINKSLKKYGLEEISMWDIIDPETKEFKKDANIFEFFTNQLERLKVSGRSTRAALKPLEEELAKMSEDLEMKGMEGILDFLKKDLDFAQNEYELSLDVEENPELADLLSSMMNVDVTDMLKDAPKSLREYTEKVNGIIDSAIRAYWQNMNPSKTEDELNGFLETFFGDNFNILDKEQFEMLRDVFTSDAPIFKDIEKLREDLIKKNRKYFDEVQKNYEQYLQNHGSYADKVREIERKKYDDLKKLDEIYYKDSQKNTYDYERKREAIINSRNEAKQKLDFEEFKDSETYIELFENLDHVSGVTLTMMINKIHEMREELTDLDPSELKKLAEYEQKLRDQMIKRNPFKNFKKEFKEYVTLQKQRKQIEANAVKAEEEVHVQEKIVSVLSDQMEQMRNNNEYGTVAYEQKETELKNENKKLETLKKQNKAAQQQVVTLNQSEQSMRARAASMAEYLGYAVQAADAISQIAQGTNDIDFQNMAEGLSDVMGNLQAAAQGFAQGGVWGAVAAGVMDLAPKLVKWFGKETGIDKAMQRSEREVKKLGNTLKNLEDIAEDAYGAITIGAQNAIRANKELQLVELERQLRLEQSRKKKKRDQDKIIDLKGQIIDLRNEINNASEDVVNDILGISGAGSWAEDLVSSMIEAFRNGEDAMEKFSEKWDEMIDNMIMKYIVSTVMQKWWDSVLKGVEGIEEAYTKDIAEEKASQQRVIDEIQGTSIKEIKKQMMEAGYTNDFIEKYGTGHWYSPQLISDEEAEQWRKQMLSAELSKISEIDGRLDQASIDATKAITDYMLGRRGEGEAIAQQLKDTIGQYYSFGDKTDKSLSQLQQGIQGITEDTAGALEAYMNGVSQQVYLQSDLLTQIRDVVVSYDPVLSMGLQSQMLLELQNSYQIQVAIQNILVGWSTPSGNAVQVSLI